MVWEEPATAEILFAIDLAGSDGALFRLDLSLRVQLFAGRGLDAGDRVSVRPLRHPVGGDPSLHPHNDPALGRLMACGRLCAAVPEYSCAAANLPDLFRVPADRLCLAGRSLRRC